MEITVESVESVKQIALSNWLKITQSVEDLNRTNRKRKEIVAPFVSCLYGREGTLIFSWAWTGIHTIYIWFSGLCTQTGIISLDFVGLQLAKGKSKDLAVMIT